MRKWILIIITSTILQTNLHSQTYNQKKITIVLYHTKDNKKRFILPLLAVTEAGYQLYAGIALVIAAFGIITNTLPAEPEITQSLHS